MTLGLHHRFDGPAHGPVLVCSNSLGSTLEMWDPVMPLFTPGHRVLRYDHPGHGRSPLTSDPLTVGGLALGLLALLDRQGIEQASFCGLSLGGMVAMWLASHRPERVDRLCLVCTSAHIGPPESWDARAALVRGADSTEVVADAVVERWFTPAFRTGRPEAAAAARTMIAATPAEGYARCCEAIRDWDGGDDLGAVRASTVVIAGREDPSTPPEHGQDIVDRISGARLEVLSPAAHLPVAEQPVAVARIVNHHLGAPG